MPQFDKYSGPLDTKGSVYETLYKDFLPHFTKHYWRYERYEAKFEIPGAQKILKFAP